MKIINYRQPKQDTLISIAASPETIYLKRHGNLIFSIINFNTLSKKTLFSQAEWAEVLHISDRTLQRYIKDNKPFEGLYADHLYQIQNMCELGLSIFKSPEVFKKWLLSSKEVLGQNLDFSTLQSFWGVKLLSNELGRLAYGIYI